VILGILQFDLHIYDAESLKDKRRVVLSVKDRLHREHMVAVAEVAHQETLNLARLGLAMVGSDGKHVGQTLDRIVAKLRAIPDAELGDVSRQVLHASQMEWQDVDPEAEALDDASLADEMLARASELAAELAGQSAGESANASSAEYLHDQHVSAPVELPAIPPTRHGAHRPARSSSVSEPESRH
jgi:uncharacterized protein YlxP (DUF503 family)